MTTAAIILFWLSLGLVFHSYVLYPLLLKFFSAGRKPNEEVFDKNDPQLPKVCIIFSVYNEEKVISQKLESIFNTSYPLDKLYVFVGSDNSTDNTNSIVNGFAARFPQLKFFPLTERNGKSDVLNKLLKQIDQQLTERDKTIFILTDANVMFNSETIYEMVKHFKNTQISQVGANIINKGFKPEGISQQETFYIQRENSIKYLEGLNWGSMIGAFGACYALRADCWAEIPKNYLMEDFYLSLNVLKRGKKAILEQQAVCYEDVSDEMKEEFKRKSRIQAGNFQNLSVYWELLFRFNAVSFCFFSHKVIRWFGPLLIALSFMSNLLLLAVPFYVFTFILQLLLLLSPLLDAALNKINVNLRLLRFASYFIMMNIALVNGSLLYLKGVETSVWIPTKRNV